MKLRIRLLICGMVLFLMIRFNPGFARAWAACFSLPALSVLRSITSPLPFPLAEWGLAACILLLFLLSVRLLITNGILPALSLILRRSADLLISLALSFILLWLPLYARETPTHAASPQQLTASCAHLIDTLNAAPLDFSSPPEDLPAKQSNFPVWMRTLSLSGFFAFPTGEALIAPDLPGAALPFVAIHEYMHALGHAGEGEANIAAWEECMRLGGVYADSARLWALRYSMMELKKTQPENYAHLMNRMNPQTRAAFRQLGGTNPAPQRTPLLEAFYRLLGIAAPTSDYGILSAHLASRLSL